MILVAIFVLVAFVNSGESAQCYNEIYNRDVQTARMKGTCPGQFSACSYGNYTATGDGQTITTTLWGCGFASDCSNRVCKVLEDEFHRIKQVGWTWDSCHINCCTSSYCNTYSKMPHPSAAWLVSSNNMMIIFSLVFLIFFNSM